MGIVIDSSVLVAAERGQLDLDTILAAHADEPAVVAAITASELLHGVHRLTGVSRARAERFVEGVCATLEVVPFDIDTARVHAALSADLRARGQAVGAHDLIIAATAIVRDFAVATRDLRSFPRIPRDSTCCAGRRPGGRPPRRGSPRRIRTPGIRPLELRREEAPAACAEAERLYHAASDIEGKQSDDRSGRSLRAPPPSPADRTPAAGARRSGALPPAGRARCQQPT